MHLTELKNTPVSTLVEIGEGQMGLENLARLRKQDIIFAILRHHAKSGEDIFGGGVLEILPDGFGFLRSAENAEEERRHLRQREKRRAAKFSALGGFRIVGPFAAAFGKLAEGAFQSKTVRIDPAIRKDA